VAGGAVRQPGRWVIRLVMSVIAAQVISVSDSLN
jgi:hypothetical protein